MPAAAVMPKRQRFVGKLIHLSSAAMARLYMFRPSPSDLGEVGGGGGKSGEGAKYNKTQTHYFTASHKGH